MTRMCLILLFIIIFASGCTVADDESQKLRELYPGDILLVDQLEVTNGSSGEKKIYNDTKQIQDWLKSIQDIEFIPSSDQSKKDGFLYSVDLFEANNKKMSFTTNYFNGKYYETNEILTDSIKNFFEKD